MTDEQQMEHPPTADKTGTQPCPSCAAALDTFPQQYVFAIGKLDVRFPSIGIEREFRRCTSLIPDVSSLSRGERLRKVLEANQHLAVRVCYVLTIGGVPAYVLAPTMASVQ